MVAVYHSSTSIHNTKNPKLDELIDKVPQTLDPVEKKRLALEAALLAKNEYSLLGVVNLDAILALGPKVGGLTPVSGIAGNAYSLVTITHAK